MQSVTHEIIDEVVEDVVGEDCHGPRSRHLLGETAEHDAHVPVAVLGSHPGRGVGRGYSQIVVELEYRLLKYDYLLIDICTW